MTTLDVGIAPAFSDAIKAAKKLEIARSKFLRNENPAENIPETVLRVDPTPAAINSEFEEINNYIIDSMAVLFNQESEGVPENSGKLGELQALAWQGDYCHTGRRAMAGRYASRVRRQIHASSRRKAHGLDGGFYDRNVTTRIVRQARDGKSNGR